MSQTKQLINTLKKLLRQQEITYADIATQLHLSETSIKRMFAKQNFSLERLDHICSMLNMDLIDLVRIHEDSQEKLSQLSWEQEQELVSDLKFLTVALSVQYAWSFDDIITCYNITESECIRYLIRLERMGLIDFLAENRIRKKVDQQFQWISAGPIEQFFQQSIQNEFFDADFTGEQEQRLYLSGLLSTKSLTLINKKLSQLVNDFQTLQRDDEKLPRNARHSCGLMLAFRPWESSVFKPLRNDHNNDAE